MYVYMVERYDEEDNRWDPFEFRKIKRHALATASVARRFDKEHGIKRRKYRIVIYERIR